jgi:chromosome segregation ATPase
MSNLFNEMMEEISEKDIKIADLEAKLEESESKVQTLLKSKDVLAVTDIAKMSVDNFNLRKENNQLKQQLAEKEKTSLVLYSMLYETLEKQGCEDIASQIDQMTGLVLDKQADWFKGNRNYDQLKQQLAEKEKEIRGYEHELENYEHELEVYKNNDNIYANNIRSFANKNKRERNQTAIAELEKVKEFIIKNNEPTKKMTAITRFINQQISELKGDADV